MCFYIKKGKFIGTKLTFSINILSFRRILKFLSYITEGMYNYNETTVYYNL